jgi:hypothetical protein
MASGAPTTPNVSTSFGVTWNRRVSTYRVSTLAPTAPAAKPASDHMAPAYQQRNDSPRVRTEGEAHGHLACAARRGVRDDTIDAIVVSVTARTANAPSTNSANRVSADASLTSSLSERTSNTGRRHSSDVLCQDRWALQRWRLTTPSRLRSLDVRALGQVPSAILACASVSRAAAR